MAYCTLDDLLKLISPAELGQLTAEAGDEPDAAVAAAAIAQAGGEIDSYLGVRYTLPLTETPLQVKSLAVDMALYHLYSRRSLDPGVRKEKYDAAIRFLKDVSLGRAVIAGASGVEPPAAAAAVVEVSSQERVFDRKKLGDW